MQARWLLVLPAALLGAIVGLAGLVALRSVIVALGLMPEHGWLAPDAGTAVIGACMALCTIMSAALAAPRARILTSLGVLLLGTWVAWNLSAMWYFPEWHPSAYQHSLLPFIGAVAGGVAGVLLVWALGGRLSTKRLFARAHAAEPITAADAVRG